MRLPLVREHHRHACVVVSVHYLVERQSHAVGSVAVGAIRPVWRVRSFLTRVHLRGIRVTLQPTPPIALHVAVALKGDCRACRLQPIHAAVHVAVGLEVSAAAASSGGHQAVTLEGGSGACCDNFRPDGRYIVLLVITCGRVGRACMQQQRKDCE